MEKLESLKETWITGAIASFVVVLLLGLFGTVALVTFTTLAPMFGYPEEAGETAALFSAILWAPLAVGSVLMNLGRGSSSILKRGWSASE